MAITKFLWKYTVPKEEDQICSLHATPKYITLGLGRGHVKIVDYEGSPVQTSHIFHTLPDGRAQEVLSIESCGNTTSVASFRSGQLELWDLPKGKRILSLYGHQDGISKSVYVESLNTLITCSQDTTTRIWDLRSGEATNKHTLEGHVTSVKYIAVYQEKIVLSSAIGEDFTVRAWDIHTGELVYQFPGHAALICSLLVFNDFLVLGLLNGTIVIWSLLNGEKITTLKVAEHEGGIHVLDRMGDYVVSGDHKGYVHLWDMATFQVAKKARVFANAISKIVVYKDIVVVAGSYGDNPFNSCGMDHGISAWKPWGVGGDSSTMGDGEVEMFEELISGTSELALVENKVIAGIFERGRNVLKVWELSSE